MRSVASLRKRTDLRNSYEESSSCCLCSFCIGAPLLDVDETPLQVLAAAVIHIHCEAAHLTSFDYLRFAPSEGTRSNVVQIR